MTESHAKEAARGLLVVPAMARAREEVTTPLDDSHVRRAIAAPMAHVSMGVRLPPPVRPGVAAEDPDPSDRDTLRLRPLVLEYDPWWRKAVGGALLMLGGATAWLADVLLRKGAAVRSKTLFG